MQTWERWREPVEALGLGFAAAQEYEVFPPPPPGEGAGAGEAALATPQGQALKEKVLNDPLVKAAKDAITSPVGIAVTGTAVAGGVAALGATGKALPFQPPPLPFQP